MLQRLNLQPLQDRRKHQRLAFLYKVVGKELPGIPPDKYVSPIRGKRLIKPKFDPQFVSNNIVTKHARKNTRCFKLHQCPGGKSTSTEDFIPQTQVYSNSFLPKTIIEWNNLENQIVSAESVEAFKHRLLSLTSST